MSLSSVLKKISSGATSIEKTTIATAGVVTLIILGTSNAAQAAILSRFDYDTSWVNYRGGEGIKVTFGITDEAFNIPVNDRGNYRLNYLKAFTNRSSKLFDDIELTKNDVGKIFTATADTNPDFKNFASLLTDGENNKLIFAKEYIGSPVAIFVGKDEKDWWYPSQGSKEDNKIDFNGYIIDQISLQLDSSDLFKVTFTIEGHPQVSASTSQSVPEPSSAIGLLLFGAGGAVAGFKRKQQISHA
ncbi:PEP-CTERM sorting domain-containing protein [Argonema galeatum]|uniref:PEP-CTERM sorting domain-containing protein n=1 Tax=Argonema galeatum TaxID=2942762 RepID=UPI002011DDFC|nr:PEP-CTERM sorting domain-containing protein [Argonema galeatum]MCL1467275.1 PEP-CTERM sorting domain-containing protein [Argonema galeatum A003/A1]